MYVCMHACMYVCIYVRTIVCIKGVLRGIQFKLLTKHSLNISIFIPYQF